MNFEVRCHEATDERVSLALELLDGRADIWIDTTPDVTVVQVGKVQMTISRTSVRVVSREGPASGHTTCHEVEMFKAPIP